MSPSESPVDDKSPGFDPRKADARYKPFPSFAEWASKCDIDTRRWERYSANLDELRRQSPELLARALAIVKRAAGFDTGAIEGLYETDRGFTLTVATEVAFWEAKVDEKGAKVRALFESQLKAYDYVLDLATQKVQIAEAWIRGLHEVICESQDTYRVLTPLGWQDQPLPKGRYKQQPNHVIKIDGSLHSWAPVDLTPSEMYRLCKELRSEGFAAAHPVSQAAYAHYAFVAVHPFADGNGRVSRAISSVFTYRSHSIPLLILDADRRDYLSALEAADSGDFQRFINFILERAIDTIRLAEESFKAASAPSKEAALEKLTMLYLTPAAYTQSWVDEAGDRLFELFKEEAKLQGHKDASRGMVNFAVEADTQGYGFLATGVLPNRAPGRFPKDGYRIANRRLWWFLFRSAPPISATASRWFQLEVPKDCTIDGDVLIRSLDTDEAFEVAISELKPGPRSTAVRMRLSIWINKLIASALDELASSASALLKQQG